MPVFSPQVFRHFAIGVLFPLVNLPFSSHHFANAQVQNSGASCLSSEFKALSYTINDVDARETNALAWLAKFGKGNCPAAELDAISNNAPLWLGTAYTAKINQAISGLSNARKSASSAASSQADTVGTSKRVPTVKKADDTIAAATPADLRESEINQCLANEIVTWNDGGKDTKMLSPSMVYVYDHQGAPEGFSEESVVASLKNASAAWDQCGGQNTVILKRDLSPSVAGLKITARWSDEDKLGTIGLANITQKTLTLSPEAFVNLRKANATRNLMETLQMVVSHEIGHFQGLTSHSRRCVDVLSYYTNASGEKCSIRNNGVMPTNIEYRSQLPTACDIQRCRASNGNEVR
jgi:hypothetical protein